tara:strand:+ start:1458 stop:2432 length:975 start_codon:yes stop_codon:yes gene_type:complete
MDKQKYSIVKKDCIKWMNAQKPMLVDCVITSPPYNLKIKYANYNDSIPRKKYLEWLGEVSSSLKRVLKDKGQIFLNMGYSNTDPFVAMDVAQIFRKDFILQNHFTWVKHIKVNETSHGIYKPISSNRYASATTESIFHFTKKGDVKVNRLSIGHRNKTHPLYPELYSEGRYIAITRRKIAKRMKYANYKDVLANASKKEIDFFYKELKKNLKEKPYVPGKKKCIGNAWYIPYVPTSRLSKQVGVEKGHNYRKNARADHPATFPEQLSTQCIKFSGIKKGSLVYDPFLGTGTTLVSAVKNKMIGIGTEINTSYINFARKRIQNTK